MRFSRDSRIWDVLPCFTRPVDEYTVVVVHTHELFEDLSISKLKMGGTVCRRNSTF